MISEAVTLEIVKQIPAVLLAAVSLGTFIVSIINAYQTKHIKHAMNSLLDARVDAAESVGRVAERADADARQVARRLAHEPVTHESAPHHPAPISESPLEPPSEPSPHEKHTTRHKKE